MLFGVRYSDALNVQFHLNSIIQRFPSIPVWRNNVFHSFSRNYFPGLRSFPLVWLSHVKVLKVNPVFRATNIPKKPQTDLPSSLNIEVLGESK